MLAGMVTEVVKAPVAASAVTLDSTPPVGSREICTGGKLACVVMDVGGSLGFEHVSPSQSQTWNEYVVLGLRFEKVNWFALSPGLRVMSCWVSVDTKICESVMFPATVSFQPRTIRSLWSVGKPPPVSVTEPPAETMVGFALRVSCVNAG